MKKIFFAAVGSCLFFAGLAQNKVVNDPNAQVRKLTGFHAIKVATGIHLYLNQSDQETVVVSAPTAEERNRIVTRVEDGVLKIYYDYDHWTFYDDRYRNLRAYVSCKVIDVLKASSGAHVEVDGTLQSGELSMDFSSGAGFKGNVAVTDLKVDQGSGAVSTISGTASTVKAAASSG